MRSLYCAAICHLTHLQHIQLCNFDTRVAEASSVDFQRIKIKIRRLQRLLIFLPGLRLLATVLFSLVHPFGTYFVPYRKFCATFLRHYKKGLNRENTHTRNTRSPMKKSWTNGYISSLASWFNIHIYLYAIQIQQWHNKNLYHNNI